MVFIHGGSTVTGLVVHRRSLHLSRYRVPGSCYPLLLVTCKCNDLWRQGVLFLLLLPESGLLRRVSGLAEPRRGLVASTLTMIGLGWPELDEQASWEMFYIPTEIRMNLHIIEHWTGECIDVGKGVAIYYMDRVEQVRSGWVQRLRKWQRRSIDSLEQPWVG